MGLFPESLPDGDWTKLRQALKRLSFLALGPGSSPTFAGLTLSNLTQGSVVFAGAGGLISQDNSNLFWDDTNNRLGIGTTGPDQPLEIRSSSPVIRLRATGSYLDAAAPYVEFGGDNAGAWKRTGYVGDAISGDTSIYLRAEVSDLKLGDSTNDSVLTLSGGNVMLAGTGEINFRDTDISIGSTLTDGILDISADVAIDMFYDNADRGAEEDGQRLNINRRAAGDDYISLYVDKDRKGLIGFSGDDDLLELAANALTVNGTLTANTGIIGESLTVNNNVTNQVGLILKGIAAAGPPARGGFTTHYSNSTTIAGYTWTNSAGQFVWRNTAQVGFMDPGMAFVKFADGSAGFALDKINLNADGGVRFAAGAFDIDASGNIIDVGSITSDSTITGASFITTQNIGISGDIDLLQLAANALTVNGEIIQAKSKRTIIGGYAIKLTNKTGGNTVAGQLVKPDTANDDAFVTILANDQEIIGIVLDADVADGSEAWVVIAGIADVLMDTGGSASGDRVISSATAGSGDVWNVGGAVATHFQEIGHCVETRIGAGLARCIVHLN